MGTGSSPDLQAVSTESVQYILHSSGWTKHFFIKYYCNLQVEDNSIKTKSYKNVRMKKSVEVLISQLFASPTY